MKRRATVPLQTSDDLVAALSVALGKSPTQRDKARIFQAVRIAVNAEMESLERGFLVEFDTAIRTWRDMPKLKGNELRLQQLVWMCDANQSAVAELNAIVVSSFAQVLLQRHGVILALGYPAGESWP